MARKVTAAVAERARELRAQGLSDRQIAAELGIRSPSTIANNLGPASSSVGSGSRARRSQAPVECDAPEPEQAEPPGQPMTREELRVVVADTVRRARREAAAARKRGEPAIAARIDRDCVASLALLARLTPEDGKAGDDDPMLIAAAARGRTKLLERVRRRAEERESWPKCSQCRQPIEPPGRKPAVALAEVLADAR